MLDVTIHKSVNLKTKGDCKLLSIGWYLVYDCGLFAKSYCYGYCQVNCFVLLEYSIAVKSGVSHTFTAGIMQRQ